MPIWSFDSSHIAFVSTRSGPQNVYVKAAGGSGEGELVLKSATDSFVSDWSRYGMAYDNKAADTGWDLWVLPLSGEKTPTAFLQTQFDENNPVFSPDGHWIAYDSNESGLTEVYVKAFPASRGRHPVSRNGGTQPMWRDDGQELRRRSWRIRGILRAFAFSVLGGLPAQLTLGQTRTDELDTSALVNPGSLNLELQRVSRSYVARRLDLSNDLVVELPRTDGSSRFISFMARYGQAGERLLTFQESLERARTALPALPPHTNRGPGDS